MGWNRVAAALTLLAAVCLGALSGGSARAGEVLDRINNRGVVNVAIVPDTPPLTFMDQQGVLRGFDVDVAAAIAERLGAVPVYVTPAWEGLLAGGWGDGVDMAVASITPTVERGKRLVFTGVYRLDAVVLVVRRDDTRIRTPSDASHRSIGVKTGTTFEQYLKGHTDLFATGNSPTPMITRPLVRGFPDNADALAALVKGTSPRLDGVVTSLARAQAAVSDGMPVRIVPGFLYFEPVAVAVDKGDADLEAKIRAAVAAMREDGTLTNLSLRWFGVDLTS